MKKLKKFKETCWHLKVFSAENNPVKWEVRFPSFPSLTIPAQRNQNEAASKRSGVKSKSPKGNVNERIFTEQICCLKLVLIQMKRMGSFCS